MKDWCCERNGNGRNCGWEEELPRCNDCGDIYNPNDYKNYKEDTYDLCIFCHEGRKWEAGIEEAYEKRMVILIEEFENSLEEDEYLKDVNEEVYEYNELPF